VILDPMAFAAMQTPFERRARHFESDRAARPPISSAGS